MSGAEVKSLSVHVDGVFYPEAEARISVFDHGLLYGDGVFEGIRAYEGVVFKLDEHLERLFESAKSIMLTIPHTKEELKIIVVECLRRNGLLTGYVRLMVTRGRGDLGLDPRKCPRPTLLVIARPFPRLYGEEAISAIVASVRRNAVTALNPMVKSLNYLNNVYAKMEANRAGVEEAIMLNQQGYVCEGTGDNIFIAKKRALITPPPSSGALMGITRASVIEIARAEGMPLVERDFTVHELYNADEVFMTGTAAELAAVTKIDGRVIGDGAIGPVTRRLSERFREYVKTHGTKFSL